MFAVSGIGYREEHKETAQQHPRQLIFSPLVLFATGWAGPRKRGLPMFPRGVQTIIIFYRWGLEIFTRHLQDNRRHMFHSEVALVTFIFDEIYDGLKCF